MKAKLILTAMAMPVLFAACTSDELVPMDQTQQQTQRPLLSKDFYLTSELEGDEETRYAVTGTNSLNFSWTEGDMYGAAIIDQFAPGGEENWPIIPSLSDNTPFRFDGSKWTAVADDLGVGHYMFTYKYNSKDNNRAAVSYSLPVIQEITKDDLNAVIKNENKAVAVALLKENEKSTYIKLRNLYAYPKFRIQFDNGQPVTKVYKVVLENNAGNGFQVAGGFNHKKVTELFDSKEIAKVVGTGKEFRDVEAYWADKQTADFVIASGETVNETFKDVLGNEYTVNLANYTETKNSKYIIAQFPEAGVNVTPDNVNNTNNKCVEVRFMLPGAMFDAEGYDWQNIDMYVYTNDGVYELQGPLNNQIQLKDGTNASAKNKIFARNTSYTITLSKDAFKKDPNPSEVITNIQEWNDFVDKYKNESGMSAVIVGEKFAFDSETHWPNKTFTINTAVKIEGNVTPKNIDVDKIIVPAGSTLNVNGLFAADEVENSGIVNFVANEDGYITESVITKIVNKTAAARSLAGVNVAKDVTTSFVVENAAGAVLTNNGEITLNEGSTNYGTITNKNLMKLDGLNNKAEDKDLDNVFEIGVDVIGTINNTKDGVIMSIAPKTKVGLTNENGALIVNDGEISCSNLNNSRIENKGTLKANGTMTYITSNDNGVVVANAAWPTNIEITGTEGIVEYTAGANANLEFVKKVDGVDTDSYVNTLNVPGNLTIAEKKLGSTLTTINVNGTGTLSLGNSIAKLNINAGTTTLGSNVTVGTKLNVAKSAKVFVPAGKTLTIANAEKNAGLDNDGSISVAGKFIASNMEKANENTGRVTESGSKSEFTWWTKPTDTTVSTAEGVYQEAVDDAIVKFWAAELKGVKETVWDNDNMHGSVLSWISNKDFLADEREDIVDAYNGIQEAKNTLNGNDEAKEVADFSALMAVDGVAGYFKTRSLYYRNTTAKQLAKDAVTKAVNKERITLDWIASSKGYAKIDKVADYKDMWIDYMNYLLGSGRGQWCYNYNADEENGADYTKYGYVLDWTIINLVEKDAKLGTAESKTNVWTVPALTIPENSYLSAETTDVNAIKAWIANWEWKKDDSVIETLRWYTLADRTPTNGKWLTIAGDNGNDVKLRIQNWFIQAYNITTPADMTEEVVHKAGTDYKSHVVTWAAPEYTKNSVAALVDLVEDRLELRK